MPRNESGGGRHPLRVWLKLALQSGLLDRIPPRCDPERTGAPCPTEEYARALLAELNDPESSDRTLPEIVAAARRFREWVEFRQKVSRRMILGQWQSEGAAAADAAWTPERRTPAPTRAHRIKRPDRTDPDDAPARPRSDPMWDDWLDG